MLSSIATVHMHDLAQLIAPFETREYAMEMGPFVAALLLRATSRRGADVSGTVAGSVARMILV
jgi:hypothetical protein